ncbi:hypothetical protein [Photorhabdus cinerea]|uniref:Uncharacterized protein n=1 Tax=Photorhabdus cinerea TaxID=471575 RepID=A0A7X5QDE8_9GAMM|nr:hypothetical protein [Photorhabdus cinerea]NHB92202.1 hypothetical protein [Photorhabdus cinerea]
MESNLLFLKEREVLSESGLPDFLARKWREEYFEQEDSEVIYLDNEQIRALLPVWKKTIDREASELVKKARGTLSGLPEGCMYRNINIPDWHKAALIVEIFRNSAISKNAGVLATEELQKKLASIIHIGEIVFVLGWGQPKRSCGGLKTLGAYADFSELYAIARLQILSKALSLVTGNKILIKVLTGGSRFWQALFTRPELTREYDRQRNSIAECFAAEQSRVMFLPWTEENFYQNEDIEKLVTEQASSVDENVVSGKISTILLNIDWDTIIDSDSLISPHNIKLPEVLKQFLITNGNNVKSTLIYAGIVSLLNPRTQNYWLAKIGNEEVFEALISFMYKVAYESARKYIAIHTLNPDSEKILETKELNNAIRLTVHVKRDRPDIPAIFTLGEQGGNKLSQHVIACVNNESKVHFMTHVEAMSLVNRPLAMKAASSDVPFSWLSNAQQPLLYFSNGCADPIEMLKRISFN